MASRTNSEDVVMPFGKHKGKTLREILHDDPRYLDWLLDREIRDPRLCEAVAEMNTKYDAEIGKAIRDAAYST